MTIIAYTTRIIFSIIILHVKIGILLSSNNLFLNKDGTDDRYPIHICDIFVKQVNIF